MYSKPYVKVAFKIPNSSYRNINKYTKASYPKKLAVVVHVLPATQTLVIFHIVVSQGTAKKLNVPRIITHVRSILKRIGQETITRPLTSR